MSGEEVASIGLKPGVDLYDRLLRYSTDLIAVVDRDGMVLYISPSFLRVFGYTYEEVVGTSTFDRVHPDDIDRVSTAVERMVEQPRAVMRERFRYRRSDGVYRVIEATATNHLDDSVVRGFVVNSRDITEQVMVEENLRDREHEYRRIFEASTDGLLISDMDAQLVAVNPALCKMHGYTESELLQLHPTQFIHPDYHSVFAQYMDTLLRGSTYHTQAVDIRKDGTSFPVEVTGSTFVYRGQRHVLASVRDISDRVEAEERRREQEARYRSVFYSASDGLAIIDLQGRFVEVNPTYCRIHGYDPEELVGKSVADVLYPDDLPLLTAGLQATQEGTTTHTRFRAIRKDGTLLYAEGWSASLEYEGEVFLLGWLRDVSHEVEAENRLQETEGQYRHIFESTQDGLIITDPRTRCVVEANPAACAMHGYRRDEFLGLRTGEFTRADYELMFVESQLDLTVGETFQTQAINVRKDGIPFNVEVHGSAFMYRGRPHILSVVRDITSRVRAEQAVREERLRLSRDLHDTVSQMLYSIGLSTRTALAQTPEDMIAVRDTLNFSLSQAERGLMEMRALISGLRWEVLELEGLVPALLRQKTFLSARHALFVEMDLGEEPDTTIEIKEALYRIAQEALNNVIKHAGATQVELTLRHVGVNLVLEVNDNGKGFTVGAEKTGHFGLHTMVERAEHLGGKVQVESGEHVGTTIRASIPMRRDN